MTDQLQAVCSVCFRVHKLYTNGSLTRHGFSIVGRQNGQYFQAWHTGPCGGVNFPHFGVSTEGTEWALAGVRQFLAKTEESLVRLATKPPLMWTPSDRAREEFGLCSIERNEGDKRNSYAKVIDYNPSYVDPRAAKRPNYIPIFDLSGYESLHERAVSRAEANIRGAKADIAMYEEAIRTWEPRDATPVKAESKTHSETAYKRAHGSVGPDSVLSANTEEVDCKACLRSLETIRKEEEKQAKRVERALNLKKGLGRKLLQDLVERPRMIDYFSDEGTAAGRLEDAGLVKCSASRIYTVTDAGKEVLV